MLFHDFPDFQDGGHPLQLSTAKLSSDFPVHIHVGCLLAILKKSSTQLTYLISTFLTHWLWYMFFTHLSANDKYPFLRKWLSYEFFCYSRYFYWSKEQRLYEFVCHQVEKHLQFWVSFSQLAIILVIFENPQRCNLMIAKRSIRLYFYVSLFTLGVTALANTVFETCLK